MAAPGTITHVLEVAQQLRAAVSTHAETIDQAAAAASPAEVMPPPPPGQA